MKTLRGLIAVCCCFFATQVHADDWVTYIPKQGPGQGKHIVFLTGDEEYRSEEGLPMLAKILSQRHGFKCTVLFAVDKDGTINPDNQKSLPGAAALDTADAIVMLLRFRNWPDDQMKHFVDAYQRGVPIIGLRTSTHAFQYPKGSTSKYTNYASFGKRVLGEQWVNHWGKHKQEATRGIIELSAKDNVILRGVVDIFGNSDVYEVYPPADVNILVRGQVLKGMNPKDPPADYKKKNQGINDPMMPVAWTRLHKNDAGKENKVFCTTMGAATDLENEGLRRLVINAVYWGLNMDVPAKADVTIVGDYKPTMYGFKGFKKGVKPSDHVLKESPAKTNALQWKDLPIGMSLVLAKAQPKKKGGGVPAGTKVDRNLQYVDKNAHERHRLDIYTPAKGAGPFPAAIWLHGGAWTQGSKENPSAAPLVGSGYILVSMNYRLLQHGDFPAQIEDCKAAVRWVRANAKKYNIDPTHIGAMGSSAGSHLAALLGTSGNAKELEGNLGNPEQSSKVQAVIDLYGPLRMNKDTTNKSNVMAHITKDCPPFLIVHGDADSAVPIKGSEQLVAALKKAGVETTFYPVKGAGHNGPEFWTDEMFAMYQKFFDKHLKKPVTK